MSHKFIYFATVTDIAELLDISPQWARVMVDKYLQDSKEVYRLGQRGRRRISAEGLRHLGNELKLAPSYMQAIEDRIAEVQPGQKKKFESNKTLDDAVKIEYLPIASDDYEKHLWAAYGDPIAKNICGVLGYLEKKFKNKSTSPNKKWSTGLCGDILNYSNDDGSGDEVAANFNDVEIILKADSRLASKVVDGLTRLADSKKEVKEIFEAFGEKIYSRFVVEGKLSYSLQGLETFTIQPFGVKRNGERKDSTPITLYIKETE